MKVETLKELINANVVDGKINFEALNKEINEKQFQPLIDKKIEETKSELIKEFNVEELSKTNEELKSKLGAFESEMLNTKKTNILLKSGIKADYLDKANKLFDVEDLENEEAINTCIEDLKGTIPTFFGETNVVKVGKVNPPAESEISDAENQIRERMGLPTK